MLEKFKNFLKKKKAQIAAFFAGTSTAVLGAVPAMAAEPGSAPTPSSSDVISGVQKLWSTLTGTMNVTTVVQIIGICLGACVVLALFWFGARYVTRKITGATKKGKVSV